MLQFRGGGERAPRVCRLSFGGGAPEFLYTVLVSDADDGAGNAIVEIYEVP